MQLNDQKCNNPSQTMCTRFVAAADGGGGGGVMRLIMKISIADARYQFVS